MSGGSGKVSGLGNREECKFYKVTTCALYTEEDGNGWMDGWMDEF